MFTLTSLRGVAGHAHFLKGSFLEESGSIYKEGTCQVCVRIYLKSQLEYITNNNTAMNIR